MTLTLPADLQRDLAALTSRSGPAVSTLWCHAKRLDDLRRWTRAALARCHLVTVARALHRALDATSVDLETLGVPVDVLDWFPRWRSGSRAGFRPAGTGLTLPPAGAAHPLGALRIQLSPLGDTIPHAMALILDLLRRTDPTVTLHVVVEPGADHGALRQLILEQAPSAEGRVHLVDGRCITVFAQDNARAARTAEGEPVLLLPHAFRSGQSREEDALTPESAAQMFGIRAIRSALHWEGGDVVHDDRLLLVGADTVRENMGRLGLSEVEVRAALAVQLGREVTVLGDVEQARFDGDRGELTRSGQAAPHVDLDVTLLGRFGRKRKPRALIADPALGLELLPAVLQTRRLFSGHFLPRRRVRELVAAEYDAFARQRHPVLLGYCEQLEAQGYEVVGLPDLRIDPTENLFRTHNLDLLYANVLPGLRKGRPSVHYLPWGIAALDRAAEQQYRRAGVTPVRVSQSPGAANALMLLRGGLRCFCGQLC